MKYYVYISESKISMLYAQIANSANLNREASLGFDIKVLKGSIKESRGVPENSLTQLDHVLRSLRESEMVGTIEQPKQYVGGVLPMKWASYGFYGENSPITFWSFSEKADDPFSGTVIALAGSTYNLLGRQNPGRASSHSLTLEMTDWFLKNLDGPFDDKRTNVHPPFFKKKNLDDYDVANGAWLAATQAGGPTAIYEFVAKILHRSQWPQGFRHSGTTQVILGSPLYVAIAE